MNLNSNIIIVLILCQYLKNIVVMNSLGHNRVVKI